MNNLSKSLLSITVSATLVFTAGCSSSDDDTSTDAAGENSTENASGEISSDNTGDNTSSTTGNTTSVATGDAADTTTDNTTGTNAAADDPAPGNETSANNGGDDDGNGLSPTVTQTVDLSAVYPELLRSLAGFQLETLASDIVLMGNSISASSSGGTPAAAGSFTIIDRGETITVENEGTLFNCESGGTLTVELGRLEISETGYSRLVELNQYQFDQCQLSNGAQQLNGGASSFFDFASGNRFTNNSNRATFTDFSWNQADGSIISADGDTMASDMESTDSNLTRTATINQYSRTNGNQLIQQIDNGLFEEAISIVASGGFQTYSLNVNGNVTDESGVPVTISSRPALSRVFVAPGFQSESVVREPFTGVIDISAQDGSQIVITATEPGDTSTRQVDIFFRAQDGTTTTTPAQNFVTFEAPVL